MSCQWHQFYGEVGDEEVTEVPSGSACDVMAALGRKFPRSGGVEADCRKFSLSGSSGGMKS